MRSRIGVKVTAVSVIVFSATVLAQEQSQDPRPAVQPDKEIVADQFDRGTPRRSAEGFLRAIDGSDYETAAEYLDLRNVRGPATELSGAQLARRLEVIIQRAEWADVEELVDDPKGRGRDGLPDYRDLVGRVAHGDGDVQILMQRVPRGDGEFIWKISNATVSQIPTLYEAYGYPELIEELRRILPKVTILGFALFKWITVLTIGLTIYGLMVLVALAIRQVMHKRGLSWNQRLFRFLVFPFGIWMAAMAMNMTATGLGRGVTAEAVSRASPIPVLITLWMLYAVVNLGRDLYSARLRKRGRPTGEVLLRPASNAMKLIIAVIAVLVYLDQLGVNITTVLAGLGVGGIAVALALQKPMEDVFGAITLYSQQPVRVGDFCRVGEFLGTIEEIGLRTTRLRTLENTLIAIPNSKLSNESIQNISAREKILYRPRLRLRYDTPPTQFRELMARIRDFLGQHERVLKDTCRVNFIEIAEDSLQIEIFAHIDTTDWIDYLTISDDLNLRLLEIVAEAGVSLSPPASTLRIEQDAAGQAETVQG